MADECIAGPVNHKDDWSPKPDPKESVNEEYGYYYGKHHVPAEGVSDVADSDLDLPHNGAWMTDRGRSLYEVGSAPRGQRAGSDPSAHAREHNGHSTAGGD